MDEPRFDPRLHLDLQHPEYIRLLTDFEKTKKYPKVTDHNGSPFAYSAPFQACTIMLANIQFAHPLALQKKEDNSRSFFSSNH